MTQCLWGVDVAFKTRYRIVADNYDGYEAQVKYWFFPLLWLEVGLSNTSSSIEGAERVIDIHKNKVVKYVD